MSKARVAERAGEAKQTEEKQDWAAAPLAPRRGLFVILMVVVIVWVGFLIGLYFRTVVPREREMSKQPTTRVSEIGVGAGEAARA